MAKPKKKDLDAVVGSINIEITKRDLCTFCDYIEEDLFESLAKKRIGVDIFSDDLRQAIFGKDYDKARLAFCDFVVSKPYLLGECLSVMKKANAYSDDDEVWVDMLSSSVSPKDYSALIKKFVYALQQDPTVVALADEYVAKVRAEEKAMELNVKADNEKEERALLLVLAKRYSFKLEPVEPKKKLSK